MNLLFALNSGYVGPMCVCLKSIMKSNPIADFDIYVAYSSLTDEDFKSFRESVDENRCRIIPVEVDDSMFNDAEILSRTSKETYYRLLAPDFLPESVDRILYLDPDIVVINPLDKFYNTHLGDKLFAGASHFDRLMNTINKRRLKLPHVVPYINAGVLLMNIEALRTESSVTDVTDFMKTTEIKLLLADQDVLNVLYFGKILAVDPLKYNLDEKTFRKFEFKINAEWVKENTVIIHYNGKNKPWKGKYKGRLGGYYFDLLKG